MNGKGSRQRGTSKEERKKFEDGWDYAFGPILKYTLKWKQKPSRLKTKTAKKSP